MRSGCCVKYMELDKVLQRLDKSAVFNEELHILCSSPNTVTAKSGKIRWAVNVACVEAVRNI